MSNPLIPYEEARLLHQTGDLWNDYCKLPGRAESDDADFERSIHELQRIMALRVARRAAPEIFCQHE